MQGRTSQQIAAALALCAFMVAIGSGLVVSLPPATTLIRAVVVLIAAYPIGRVIGLALQSALNEHLTAVTATNPVPEIVRAAPAGRAGEIGEVDVLDEVEMV